MQLLGIDWAVVALYGVVVVVVGLIFVRRAGRGTQEYFLSGRSLPWWLLGTSMVATTFSTDTPNLVTNMVRTNGVSNNWQWWAFLITGMCTVFIYAKLWRRSKAFTDIGFYELRYAGKPAAFLRGFRALYLGVFFNVVIMATVTLAAVKIAGVLLGLKPLTTVIVAGAATALYSTTSGLWGVVVTDFLLFFVAMIGSVAAAVYALRLPEVGGLAGLFSHPAVADKLSLLPDFSNWSTAAAVFVIPVAVQWWSVWYPGAEPGGGGYIAQRMLAARSEKDAMGATLWFNIAHYALRPWPWILVALASIVVYPDLASLAARFPELSPSIIRHDLAYPAMLVFLPHGLLGLVVASLAAAYMSTISTHLNWGASYIVDDFYRRFVTAELVERHYVAVGRIATVGLLVIACALVLWLKDAWHKGAVIALVGLLRWFWWRNKWFVVTEGDRAVRHERHYVAVGRSATIVLIVLACALALWLEDALQGFQILLQIGAGTGLIFLLRWFWWRINAWSEISAMVISFVVALYFQFVHQDLGFAPLDPSLQLVTGVAVTTAGWLIVTFLTPPTSQETLQSFYDRIHPHAAGWRNAVTVRAPDGKDSMAAAILCWFLGIAVVYSSLFGTGYVLYGRSGIGVVCLAVAGVCAIALFRTLPRVGFE